MSSEKKTAIVNYGKDKFELTSMEDSTHFTMRLLSESFSFSPTVYHVGQWSSEKKFSDAVYQWLGGKLDTQSLEAMTF